jgi:hypothetical protein
MASYSWKQAAVFAAFSALSLLSVDGFVTPLSSKIVARHPSLFMADVAVDEKVANGLAFDSDKIR